MLNGGDRLDGVRHRSPATWAEADRAIVVGTTGIPAIRAAVQALRRGANAADAAMVAALAQTTLAAGSWASFAGIMSMVYYEADSRTVHSMNAAYDTVRGERDPLSIPGSGRPSGRSALVPGFMAGVQAVHDRFGRLPFRELFEPAIDLAGKGFVIGSVLDRLLRHRADVLTRSPQARDIFLKDRTALYREGDVFRQPQLAETLARVASDGAAYMYTGEWGTKLVRTLSSAGGKLTKTDLEKYRVIWSEPLRGTYRGYDVVGPGLPGLGGVYTIEALNLLEAADLVRHGHYSASAEHFYWLIQITHAGYLASFLAPEARVEKETADRLWHRMRQRGGLTLADSMTIGRTFGHSDGIVAVDERGNVASVCHSSCTLAWGTTGVFVDGISIPDTASFQQEEIARVGVGARLPDPMNPLIVLREGKQILASSCTGTSLHEVMIQHLINILDFGMPPKSAVETPSFMGPLRTGIFRLLERDRYWSFAGPSLFNLILWASMAVFPPARRFTGLEQAVEEGDFSEEVLGATRRRGQRIRVVDKDLPLGFWCGVQTDPLTGRLRGAVTARSQYGDAAVDGY